MHAKSERITFLSLFICLLFGNDLLEIGNHRLHLCALFDHLGHLLAGVDDRGMIAAKGVADARQGEAGHLAREIHSHMARQGNLLLAGIAATFTAIDHNKYKKLSMVFYILMGWFIVICFKQTVEVLTVSGMLWILFGGISYTIGAVLYGIGHKKPIFHTVFHVFVVIGTLLQAIGILFYVL